MSNEKTDSLILIVAEEKGGRWVRKDAGEVRRTLNDAYKSVRDVGRGMRASPVRWISEKVFSGFGEKMKELREVDDQIKLWTDDLDNCLDRAKEAQKAGRMPDAIFWISQINNRLQLTGDGYQTLNKSHELDLTEFHGGFEKDDEGYRKYKYDDDDYLTGGEGRIVQAGLMDDLGRKITNWKMKQMYKEKIQQRERALEILMTQSTLLVDKVERRLAEMSAARSNGDIPRYMASLNGIAQSQRNFEKLFRKEFDANFKSLITAIKNREAELAHQQKLQQTKEQFDKNFQPLDDMLKKHKPELEKWEKSEQNKAEHAFREEQTGSNNESGIMSQWGDQLGQLKGPPIDNGGNLGGMVDSTYPESARSMPSERAPAVQQDSNQPRPGFEMPGAVAPEMAPAREIGEPTTQGVRYLFPDAPAESQGPMAHRAPSSMLPAPNNGEVAYPGTPPQEFEGPIHQFDVNVPKAAPPPAPARRARAPKKKEPEKTVVSPQLNLSEPDEGPQTQRSAAMQALLLKKSHLEFYGQLEKAAKLEDPYLLAAMLSKYSEQVEQQDPDTSDELLTLAETIINV